MPTLFEKPVRVGESKWVHARSGFYDGETRCGLQHTAQTYFRDTREEITCPHCLRAKAA